MPNSTKCLLIGSTESYSGKSAAVLGIAYQLQERHIEIAYGKPLGTCPSESQDDTDEDVRLITQLLNIPSQRVLPTLLFPNDGLIAQRLQGEAIDYGPHLQPYTQIPAADLVLIEGAGTLEEGRLFGLSIAQLAEAIDAATLLVARFHANSIVDQLLAAKFHLGHRLIGILVNDVPQEQLEFVDVTIRNFLESQGIPVLGMLPSNQFLRSVSVAELVKQLDAQVLCCRERLDLMVSTLKIGAMNVNSALKYLRTAENMAVVTGGDRTDIQLAALETSTQCLILTGQIPPIDAVISRAEDLEIPILSVDLDTLTTVEIIDRTFGQVRLHEPAKVQCIRYLMEKHFDTQRLLEQLGLASAAKVG